MFKKMMIDENEFKKLAIYLMQAYNNKPENRKCPRVIGIKSAYKEFVKCVKNDDACNCTESEDARYDMESDIAVKLINSIINQE